MVSADGLTAAGRPGDGHCRQPSAGVGHDQSQLPITRWLHPRNAPFAKSTIGRRSRAVNAESARRAESMSSRSDPTDQHAYPIWLQTSSIGRYIETTIPRTMPPARMIIAGSRIEVSRPMSRNQASRPPRAARRTGRIQGDAARLAANKRPAASAGPTVLGPTCVDLRSARHDRGVPGSASSVGS